MKKLILLAIAAVMAIPAMAQQVTIATGSSKGTYSTMHNQLVGACGAGNVGLVEKVTSGSVENMDLLMNNQVNAAWTQMDVLFLRSQSTNLGNLKTLATMHQEEVHIIVPVQGRKYKETVKKPGIAGTNFGAKEEQVERIAPPINSFDELQGKTVGAAGGSYMTAQVIRLQSQVAFNVTEMASGDEAIKALQRGEIDAALLVGGQPLGNVTSLSGVKFLPINESVQDRLKNVYNKASLTSYMKLTGGRSVPTVSVDAIILTRDYKTPAHVAALVGLRKCLFDKLDELKETTGLHPKWQMVDSANHGKWAWYEPAGSQPVMPASRKK